MPALPIPKTYQVHSTGNMAGALNDLALNGWMSAQAVSTFMELREQAVKFTTEDQLYEAIDSLNASMQQAYMFHVQALALSKLTAVLDRTVMSSYINGTGLYSHLDTVPETVNISQYHHTPVTARTH